MFCRVFALISEVNKAKLSIFLARNNICLCWYFTKFLLSGEDHKLMTRNNQTSQKIELFLVTH